MNTLASGIVALSAASSALNTINGSDQSQSSSLSGSNQALFGRPKKAAQKAGGDDDDYDPDEGASKPAKKRKAAAEKKVKKGLKKVAKKKKGVKKGKKGGKRGRPKKVAKVTDTKQSSVLDWVN